jgi:phospholipid transport system substrate-binding protein
MKFLAALFSFAIMAGSAHASTNGAKAEAFARRIADEGIKQIINSDAPQEVRNERFEKLFNEALDLDFIGQFVLGRYWRTATEEQRREFIQTYREFNIRTWSRRFDEFRHRAFIWSGTRESQTPNQVFVDSTVPMEQGEPVRVVWRIRLDGDKPKVIDIIIENVSLAITVRDEYTTFIKNNGGNVQALIDNLQSRIAQLQ